MTARDRVEKALETAKIRNLDMLFAAEFAQALLESWLEMEAALGEASEFIRYFQPTHTFHPETQAYKLQGVMMDVYQKQRSAYESARAKLETNQEG